MRRRFARTRLKDYTVSVSRSVYTLILATCHKQPAPTKFYAAAVGGCVEVHASFWLIIVCVGGKIVLRLKEIANYFISPRKVCGT